MGKIVYLLGAGASYGIRNNQQKIISFDLDYQNYFAGRQQIHGTCPNIEEGLPIVSELPDRMKYILYRVNKEMHDFVLETHPSHQILEGFADDLEWLQIASSRHSTVDTFAKKLWITHRSEDYRRLKHTLSAYFMVEQFLNPPDKRYDSFFASILGENVHNFPHNICILSWNYDCQFELAYSEYSFDKGIYALEHNLHFYQKTLPGARYFSDKSFSVIKLNGSALLLDSSTGEIIDPYFFNNEQRDIASVITRLYSDQKNRTALSFAWEESQSWFTDTVKANIKDAEILVVIGYSFPYFNRDVDKYLFQSMPGLKKIYLQDIDPDTIEQSVTNLLTASHTTVNKTKIEKKYHIQQFYLPPEL